MDAELRCRRRASPPSVQDFACLFSAHIASGLVVAAGEKTSISAGGKSWVASGN